MALAKGYVITPFYQIHSFLQETPNFRQTFGYTILYPKVWLELFRFCRAALNLQIPRHHIGDEAVSG